jgi:hypothetical protein
LVVKLLQAKSILGSNGKVVQVWCKVCNLIESKKKLLVPKLDYFWKHVGNCKVLVAMLGVKVRQHYCLKSNAHVVNEKFYVAKGPKQLCSKSLMVQFNLLIKKGRLYSLP